MKFSKTFNEEEFKFRSDEKFSSKSERKHLLFYVNHIFNKYLDYAINDGDLSTEKLTIEPQEFILLLYVFRCLVGKEVDKVLKQFINDELAD